MKIAPTVPGRTPDFKIDGVSTELKTMSGVQKQAPDGLSGALVTLIKNARGQAGNIVVDAREQPGMTKAIAQRGIDRAVSLERQTRK